MPRFEHKKIAEKLIALDQLPDQSSDLSEWVRADAHLSFLNTNAESAEIVIYAAPEYSFIYSMAVPADSFSKDVKSDLMKWDADPYTSAASYVSGGGKDGIWVERDTGHTGSKTLSQGRHLIFGRFFEGWNGEDRHYFELSQEYAHLEGLHFRREQHGYCKFDKNGDLVSIVSITKKDSNSDISLVTFDRNSLEQYLTASNQVLVRLFDFTLLDRSNFSAWGSGPEEFIEISDNLFYKQKIRGPSAYTRGVQIIRPHKPEILKAMQASWHGEDEKRHVEFIAYDWRNKVIRAISTDPDSTTNYFEAENNNLPFELSPAFFKPEVLLKYKADKEKYTVDEREIHCRASWFLEAFDTNEAGQIFAYICYLRRLPETELLHWLSFNEEAKAPISKRAFVNDFEGKFVDFSDPLEDIKRLTLKWDTKKYNWWKMKDPQLLKNVSVPLTSSRDEWGDSFLALTQLVNEGFQIKIVRELLRLRDIKFEKLDGSLFLLEKLIGSFKDDEEDPLKLVGLRTAQLVRTKVKGHRGSEDAEKLALEAIENHETFSAHFRFVCEQIMEELEIAENVLNKSIDPGL